jgi:hypothetical protein
MMDAWVALVPAPKASSVEQHLVLEILSESPAWPSLEVQEQMDHMGYKQKTNKVPTSVDSMDILTELLAVAFITYPAPGTGISTSEGLERSRVSEPRPPEAPYICSSGLRLILSCK